MYLEYYTLDRPPFRITPDPSLFYTGGENGRGVVLEALLYAVIAGEGILKVVGEVGSGKTMLCRMLEQRLPDTVEVVYLANPNLAPHEILYAIAFELKLPVDHTTQRLIVMQHLQEYLLKQHAVNRTVLVIIEEAQSMPIETLEEVRLFSNLETHQHKLMQIVMFGQPELDKNLQDKSIRQLRERITHSFDLRPLNEAEVSDYIRFRLQAAGCPAPQIFSNAAEKMIAKASCGLTRRINILADKAMLAAYAESATSKRPRSADNLLQPVVLPKHVKAAVRDSGYETSVIHWPKAVFASAIVVIFIVVVGWWYFFAPNAMSYSVADNAIESHNYADNVTQELFDDSAVQASSFTATVPISTESKAQEVVEVISQPAIVEQEPLPALQNEMLFPIMKDEFDVAPSLLRERSEETRRWLKVADSQAYTLQLMTVGSDESDYVTYVLGRLQHAGLVHSTYTCVFGNNDQKYWKMIYGEFHTAVDARAVIGELPAIVKNNGPFVQRIERLDCID